MVGAFSPLDRELGLLSSQYTPQVYEWLVQLCVWMPFGVAVKLLAAMVGVRVSKATAVRATEAAGAAYVALQDATVTALEAHSPEAPPQVARLVVSADGAMVPLVHGEWAEVRTLAIGAVPAATPPAEAHTTAISYFSRLTNAESFTRLALFETQRRGLENAPAVAAVMDGAEWLQTLVDYHCPQAVRILDFAHAAQRISEIGQALWGQGSATATTWIQTWTHRLKHEGPKPLLRELHHLQRCHPDHETLRINVAYFEKRQAQLQYPAFQQAGWPIGSGMVESANKLVVEARLKGAGMHWAPGHVNPMVALRNLACSDCWPSVWPAIHAQLVTQSVQHRTAPYHQRLMVIQQHERDAAVAAQHAQYAAHYPAPPAESPAESPPPKTAKPAADHPWRRAPIGRARFANLQNTKI